MAAGFGTMGGGLQTTRGYTPEHFYNLAGLNFVYSGTGVWSFFDSMTDGKDFRTVGGLCGFGQSGAGPLVTSMSFSGLSFVDFPCFL